MTEPDKPCHSLKNYGTNGPNSFGAITHGGRVFADMIDAEGILIRRAVVACCQNAAEAKHYCDKKNKEVQIEN